MQWRWSWAQVQQQLCPACSGPGRHDDDDGDDGEDDEGDKGDDDDFDGADGDNNLIKMMTIIKCWLISYANLWVILEFFDDHNPNDPDQDDTDPDKDGTDLDLDAH